MYKSKTGVLEAGLVITGEADKFRDELEEFYRLFVEKLKKDDFRVDHKGFAQIIFDTTDERVANFFREMGYRVTVDQGMDFDMTIWLD